MTDEVIKSKFQKVSSDIEIEHTSFRWFIVGYFATVLIMFIGTLLYCSSSGEKVGDMLESVIALVGILTAPLGFMKKK